MPGKARPGKQKRHSGAKKRTRVTAKGTVQLEKAAARHRLNAKSKGQKNQIGNRFAAHKGDAKNLKTLLSS